MNNKDIAILEKYGRDNITSIVLLDTEYIPEELKDLVSKSIQPVKCSNLKKCFKYLMADDNLNKTYTLVIVNTSVYVDRIKDFNVDIDNSYAIVYCVENKTIDLRLFEKDMRTKELTFKNTNDETTIIAKKALLKNIAFLSDEGIIVKEDCVNIDLAGNFKKYYDNGDNFCIIRNVVEYDLLSNIIKSVSKNDRKTICLFMLDFIDKVCSVDSFKDIMVIKNRENECILVVSYNELSETNGDTVARFIYAAALGLSEILPEDRDDALVVVFNQLRKKLAENRSEYSSELLVQLDELLVNNETADVVEIKYTINRMK